MKEILIAFCAILVVTTGLVIITAEDQNTHHLLGTNVCLFGPSFWCRNITNAAKCTAMKHCIKNEWVSLTVPKDNDSVCGICKQMVTDARNQLESNQTQEDLKNVFDGSCKLIHIKPIVDECIKLVNDFIPELLSVLESQMDPSVVCTVAGLCNSAHIDELLLKNKTAKSEMKVEKKSFSGDELDPDDCSKCFTIATHMEHKFQKSSDDKFVERLLIFCRQLGSFSDGCSSIVLTNYKTIYNHLKNNLKAKDICHLSGMCSAQFHKHDEKSLDVEIRPLSSVGMVEVSDDLPCKLCEQLVGHLRDLLVANTTESEFEMVLEGFCKQTNSFAAECKTIVDQYYLEIYSYLTTRLDSNAVCSMIGICPSPDKSVSNGPIWPILPEKSKQIAIRIMNRKEDLDESASKVSYPRTEAEKMQLPIERFDKFYSSLAFPQMDVEGKGKCAFCEYFFHFLQQETSTPANEENIKQLIDKICKKLPSEITGMCDEFVQTYGDAAVAIIVQQIDPATVCPMLHVCPSEELMDLLENIPSDMVVKTDVKDKPSCPLCLLAVTQIYNVIKDNKTEENIKNELDKLCDHLKKNLKEECYDLVKGYSDELIKMLLADLAPREICVYIKLCNSSKSTFPSNFFPLDKNGEILTNEIPDVPLHTIVDKPVETNSKCALCEFIMEYVDKKMNDKKTSDEIETIIHEVCDHLPETVKKECNGFVNQYGKLVISLLANEINPKALCSAMKFCDVSIQMQESITQCKLCQEVASEISKRLNLNPDKNIEETVSKVCNYVSAVHEKKCTKMMDSYKPSIVNILKDNKETKEICSRIVFCSSSDLLLMSLENRKVRRDTKHWGHWGK